MSRWSSGRLFLHRSLPSSKFKRIVSPTECLLVNPHVHSLLVFMGAGPRGNVRHTRTMFNTKRTPRGAVL